MKLFSKFILHTLIISAILCFFGNDLQILAVNQPNMQIQLTTPNKLSGGEKAKAKFNIQRTEENKNIEFTFNLSTNNSSLIQFSITEIKLLAGQERAEFEFNTLATPIKTSATIKVVLSGSSEQSEAENTIEIVPALIKNVFSQPSMIGTHGAKVNVTVELKVPAPMGGIELYPSQLYVSGSSFRYTFPFSNIRVPAGSNKFGFFVEYDGIRSDDIVIVSQAENPTGSNPHEFNTQKRTVELYISIDPIIPKDGIAVSDITKKATFEVIPILVSSISVEPTLITGGNEALGSFTLNVAPGNDEKIRFKPIYSGSNIWIRPLGSSCREDMGVVEIPLTQGVTNYNFKVCTARVSTIASGKIEAILRSGKKEGSVRIQP